MTGDVHYQHDSTSLVRSSYSENPWQCYDKALLTLDVSVCQIVRPLPSPISLPTNSTCCNSPWRLQLSLHLVDMTLSRGKPQQLNKMTLRWTPSLNGLQGTNGRCEPQCPMTSVTWRKAIRAWLRLLNLNRNYSYSKSRFYCILLHYHLWIHS